MNIPADVTLFFSLTIRTSLLLMFGLAALRLARRYSPGLRYELAVATVVTALLIPVGHLAMPSLDILPLESLPGQNTISRLVEDPGAEESSTEDAHAAIPQTDVEQHDASTRGSSSSGNVMIESVTAVVASVRTMSPGQIAGALWLLGVLLMLVRVVLARLALARLWRSALQPNEEDWADILEEAGDRVFLTRDIDTRELRGIRSPMTWGIFRPKLLLPAEARHWSRERKLNALMHEMVHVRRLDALYDVLSAVLLVVNWFNPLAWMVRTELKASREASCDREVLQLGAEPQEYASMLIDVAKDMRSHRATPRLAMTIARPSQLEGRVLSVLNYRGEGLVPSNRWVVAGISTFMLLFIAAAAPGGSGPENGSAETAPAFATPGAVSATPGSASVIPDDTGSAENEETRVSQDDRMLEVQDGYQETGSSDVLTTGIGGDEVVGSSRAATPGSPSGHVLEPGWEGELENASGEEAIVDLFAVAGIQLADAVLQELGQSVESMDWSSFVRDLDWSAEGDGLTIDGNDALDAVQEGDIVEVMSRFSDRMQTVVVDELERIVVEEPGTTKARRARKALIEIDSEASRSALTRLGMVPIGQ